MRSAGDVLGQLAREAIVASSESSSTELSAENLGSSTVSAKGSVGAVEGDFIDHRPACSLASPGSSVTTLFFLPLRRRFFFLVPDSYMSF